MQYTLLRYLCSKMFGQQFSKESLRERITNESVALRRTRMARRDMRDMRRRAIKCMEHKGGHVERRYGI